MKKIIFLVLSIVFMFGFLSCATFNNIGSQQNLTIKTNTFETIDGVTTVNTLKIQRLIKFSHTSKYDLFFKEIQTPKISFYKIEVLYDGQGWIFYENIDLKIDSQIYHLPDDNPSRNIIQGSRVQERISIILTDELIKEIQKSSSLTIGLSTILFSITPEELGFIKNFLPKL